MLTSFKSYNKVLSYEFIYRFDEILQHASIQFSSTFPWYDRSKDTNTIYQFSPLIYANQIIFIIVRRNDLPSHH